jgi:hypothetical protein
MDAAPPPLFDKLIGRPRSVWVTLGIGLLLIASSLVVALLDGVLGVFFSAGYWRPMWLAPVIIIYILAIAPIQQRSQASVITAFRPLALVDDDQFDRVVQRASHIPRTGEAISVAVGFLFGLWLGIHWRAAFDTPWIKGYVSIALVLMFGLLAWVIYGSVASTRLTSELHALPLQVDILDREPFEAIGRHSLVTALIFVGGILLGIVFGLDVQNILAWQTWLFYGLLGVVPVLIFFLSMHPTHRVLRDAKTRELAMVKQRLQQTRATLRQHITEQEALGATATEYSALVAYEARVRAAQTWPYNMSMLRTLVVSLLLPLLVRAISAVLFD